MSPRGNVVCRTELAQARGSFERTDARRWCRRMHLDVSKVSSTHRMQHCDGTTIYALESATRWRINVVAIRAE